MAKLKSISELEREVKGLKKALDKTKKYSSLEQERKKIMKDIKKEGWKRKHKKALSILHKAGLLAKQTYKTAKPYAKKLKKRRKSKHF